jgi:hypothetical protein
MNKEELKTLVKKYFNLTENITTENNEEVKEQSFTEATLADGTKITNMVDGDFEVGQTLHVITESGEHVLAPSGEHTTESGIVITVDGEGIITGVHHPDSEGDGSLAEQEMAAEETTTEENKTELAEEEVIEEVAMEDGDVKEAIIEAIAEVVAPEIEAMKKKMAEIEEAMKEHMSAPAAQPTKESKFAKEGSSLDFLSTNYNFKKAQLDAILNKRK